MGESSMIGWKKDKRWSDKFLNEIKGILGQCLINEPPIEEDQEHNTDLVVLKLDSVRIACRMRRFQYFQRYPNDFTIRSNRNSGVKTELDKIIEGWGDYFFYGFSNAIENRLIKWFIGDLKIFRLWFARYLAINHKPPGMKHDNFDDSSSFYSYDALKIPNFIKWYGDYS